MKRPFWQAAIRFIFFGNYFYGLCAVALSIEASLQQQYPLNNLLYYIIVFCATVLYYTRAYITDNKAVTSNQRTNWYIEFKRWVVFSQIILTIIVTVGGGIFLYKNWQALKWMSWQNWVLKLIFPLTAALYYGINSKKLGRYNLRNSGWLKPFVIGFSWAGLVTVYPVLFYSIDYGLQFQPTLVGLFLFIKNFMFITVLCIMFDIKDYAVDYNRQLKTFVVKVGLRNTIFYIIIPLCVIGLVSFVSYAMLRHFHFMKIALNIIPFAALIAVAWSMHRRQSILYYLVIIDGLMLVKALCGTIAMIYF
jgi:hypothetical protein